ncbi:MAG TPA: hypothetical protein VKD71_00710 [Gemmataceae bacterium]|nr:hypothetical protein [Gemmataceae bacterium]
MFLFLVLPALLSDPNDFIVPRGQLTFDAEGQEGGRWHSRKPHVPSDASGLTIGRGYDMKFHTAEQITKQLTDAGLSNESAKLYAGAARMSGEKAREYMRKTDLPEITPAQQKALFLVTYDEISESARRVCTSDAVTKEYGAVGWDKLNSAIRELVIDLRYRGDYTRRTRERVQPLVVKNDLKELATLMADREFWSNVPEDRFKRRAAFAKEAAAKGK